MNDETNCAYCGFTPPTHAENCPMLPENLREARPDEMAAGVIHEPGTGGGDPQDALKRAMIEDALVGERPPKDRDHCGYVDDDDDNHDLHHQIVMAVLKHAYDVVHMPTPDSTLRRADQTADAVLSMVQANIQDAVVETQRARTIAEQQRDTLSRQVDSLVQRLAASHVAAGLIDMAAAQGFVQKEILPINQVLAQIAAQPQPEQST